MSRQRLRERLAKVRAMYLGATTGGERDAAAEALRRLQAKLEEQPAFSDGERHPAGRCRKWRASRRTRDARGRWTRSSGTGEGQEPQAGDDASQSLSNVRMTFNLHNHWEKIVFLALARRHRLRPFRHRRWPELTVILDGPEGALEDFVLALGELSRMLAPQLAETTRRFVLENVDRGIPDHAWQRWWRF